MKQQKQALERGWKMDREYGTSNTERGFPDENRKMKRRARGEKGMPLNYFDPQASPERAQSKFWRNFGAPTHHFSLVETAKLVNLKGR